MAWLGLPGMAAAQLATIVVPAEASVVVPPRGAAAQARPAPRLDLPAPPRLARLPPPPPAPVQGPGGELSPGMAALAVVPLAAAVALAAGLPGGGGASGPVRTR